MNKKPGKKEMGKKNRGKKWGQPGDKSLAVRHWTERE